MDERSPVHERIPAFRWPPRVTLRRLMVVVALAAVPCFALRGGPTPGLHVAAGPRLRAGICRDDADGFQRMHDGSTGSGTFLVGFWRPGCPAEPVIAIKLRDGWACCFLGPWAPVVLW